MSLIFITSPAKTLDESKNWKNMVENTSIPMHLETATSIADFLRKQTQPELQETLSVSEKLAELNYSRMKEWEENHTENNSKPAILLYNGAVYKEMNPKEYSAAEQYYTQNHIRIISAFYGLIRPYDLIQPYRLEMKTPLKLTGQDSLVSYWSENITSGLNEAAKNINASAIINLASNEYSSAVNVDKLLTPFISVDFKENRGGTLKTIAIYTKKARGAMMEFAIKNTVQSLDALRSAKPLGYSFNSQENTNLLFTRNPSE